MLYDIDETNESFTAKALKLLQTAELAPRAPRLHVSIPSVLLRLSRLFREKEAASMQVEICPLGDGTLGTASAILHFDDVAFRSSERHEALHAAYANPYQTAEEQEAESTTSSAPSTVPSPSNPAAQLADDPDFLATAT